MSSEAIQKCQCFSLMRSRLTGGGRGFAKTRIPSGQLDLNLTVRGVGRGSKSYEPRSHERKRWYFWTPPPLNIFFQYVLSNGHLCPPPRGPSGSYGLGRIAVNRILELGRDNRNLRHGRHAKKSLKAWVIVIPNAAWAHMAVPTLFLVWTNSPTPSSEKEI